LFAVQPRILAAIDMGCWAALGPRAAASTVAGYFGETVLKRAILVETILKRNRISGSASTLEVCRAIRRTDPSPIGQPQPLGVKAPPRGSFSRMAAEIDTALCRWDAASVAMGAAARTRNRAGLRHRVGQQHVTTPSFRQKTPAKSSTSAIRSMAPITMINRPVLIYAHMGAGRRCWRRSCRTSTTACTGSSAIWG
jgi:hypothetical protein